MKKLLIISVEDTEMILMQFLFRGIRKEELLKSGMMVWWVTEMDLGLKILKNNSILRYNIANEIKSYG
jgi:hypothetical protein